MTTASTPHLGRDAAERIRRHFDGFAPEYHRRAFDGAGMAHLSDLDLVSVRQAASLVRTGAPAACDVGVGTGRISAELVRLGFAVTGVDASPGMLRQAQGRLGDVDLRLGSLAERLPVDDDSADLVTCLRVVKYLPDWRHAIAELARVTAPGGVVCFDLANAHSPARVGYPAGMVWPVTHRAAVAAIVAAGLEVTQSRPGVHLPDPVWRSAGRPAVAGAVRAVESLATVALGRHGARSWTFVCRKPDTAARRPAAAG